MHSYLSITDSRTNIEAADFEVVERKGLGHPDTLADGLAEAVSREYSLYCLKEFGAVLHHNVDKVYIGGGHFVPKFGDFEFLKPIRVSVNGRISNRFADHNIDIAHIQKQAVQAYISLILPHLEMSKHLRIETNATQHTKKPYWFTPRGLDDIPDATNPKANDTSVCVAYAPLSYSERLVYSIEQFFWHYTRDNQRSPRFEDVGQDIKVFLVRRKNEVEVTVCVPLLALSLQSQREYEDRIRHIEDMLNQASHEIAEECGYSVNIRVNPLNDNSVRIYMLGIGSCIECGEEGLVGRGNSLTGLISVFRPHSMEAPYGKNPVYHVGKVQGYLTKLISEGLYNDLGIPNSICVAARNGGSLIPPDNLIVNVDPGTDKAMVAAYIDEKYASTNYLSGILSSSLVI